MKVQLELELFVNFHVDDLHNTSSASSLKRSLVQEPDDSS